MIEAKNIIYFNIKKLLNNGEKHVALLINPPIYDVQYWAEWSQPYGLLRIASLLKKYKYKKVLLYDFMETDENRKVKSYRINPDESYNEINEPVRPIKPIIIQKNGEKLELFKRHYGKTWNEFENWLVAQGFNRKNPPDEVWISAIMTYWWESVRDLTIRIKRLFGKKTKIILGGVYSTLVPDHAAKMTDADVIVAGDIEEANDLWTDISLYDRIPDYAVITPSRGCPYNCAYCAQKKLNVGRTKVWYRDPDDIIAEMMDKYNKYGIREFAFYADYLLINYEKCLLPVLKTIVKEKLPFYLYAPEGFDTLNLSRSQELVDMLKAARFEKIYLPLEHLDHGYLKTLNRKHVTMENFIKSVNMCQKAGFKLRNMAINAFVLYGLPKEKIDDVVKTILFVSEVVGSIIPMLFAPVPSTQIYGQYKTYFKKKGWDKNLHMLNGKLFPFLEINEGSINDYIDLQRLMYTLNSHYRDKSFRIFGNTKVSESFRENISNGFSEYILQYSERE